MAGLASVKAPFPTVVTSSTFKSGISGRVSLNFLRAGAKYPSSSPSFSSSLRKDAIAVAARASVGSVESVAELATEVKFPEVTVPGCNNFLVLLGLYVIPAKPGYGLYTMVIERVFAIIGVKVFVVVFFINPSVKGHLSPFNGGSEMEDSYFRSIYKGHFGTINDVITPRAEQLTDTDEAALLVFRTTFMDHNLRHIHFSNLGGTFKVVADGLPDNVDAQIESSNVNTALFDGFSGNSPASPSLMASVVSGIQAILN